MFNDASGFKHIYMAFGYTDLRRGIDGLAATIQHDFNLDPADEGSIFLFCGRRTDRIKALVWEGDGFLLLYKRLANGRFQWPRNEDEVREITPQQLKWLMDGMSIQHKKTISKVSPKHFA